VADSTLSAPLKDSLIKGTVELELVDKRLTTNVKAKMRSFYFELFFLKVMLCCVDLSLSFLSSIAFLMD
jgi:hypothetical protein